MLTAKSRVTGDQASCQRWNERVKLVGTLFNSVAIVTLAAALINPMASRRYDVLIDGGWILILGAIISQVSAQSVLTFFVAVD